MSETITVLPGPTFDAKGDPIAPAETDGVDVDGCVIAPRFSGGFQGSGEINQRGHQGVIIGYTVYAPPTIVIDHSNLVRWRYDLYKVDGEPGLWSDDGVDVGTQFDLVRTKG